MHNIPDAGRVTDYPLQVVLQALLANNLTSFTEFAFGVVRPGITFKPNWHFEAVTYKLSQVASGDVRRLIITLPPRTLKSLCASVALPAWYLGRNPSERVLFSYSDFLARSHANHFRLLVKDPIYQAAFPAMRLARDTDREIMTTKRGKRIATSIDGTLTGLGGNLIVIDNPIKLGDAMSETVRTRAIEWYRSTLLSRADDKKAARIVLVMQRVHQADLAGYLQEQGGFEVLNLPAIAQRNETYSLGDGRSYNRQKGELLHPEQEPAHVLAELKREMGPIAFGAVPAEPDPARRHHHQAQMADAHDNVDREPGDRIILSWDIALSETETGDYSACVVLLQRGEVYYILEVVRGRFPFDALKRKVMEIKRRYGSSTLLIEEFPDQSRPHPKSAGAINQRHGLQARNRQACARDCVKRLVCRRLGAFSRACELARGVHRRITRFLGAMTSKSMRSPRASHGVVKTGRGFLRIRHRVFLRPY